MFGKLFKCEYAVARVMYFWHKILSNRISVHQKDIPAIEAWRKPMIKKRGNFSWTHKLLSKIYYALFKNF